MDKIKELSNKIAAARADKHERNDSLTLKEEAAITETVKAMSAELVAAIVEGANGCSGCDSKPHGMVQTVAIKNEPVEYFEIGCLSCADKRAQGFTREQVVAKWNAGKFLKG